jgi:hypothetical protein
MMDTTDIIRLLNTDHYSPANLEEVNDLCRNYPMFNVGHLLKLRIMEALGRPLEDELRLAAVYSSDRVRLLQLVREVVREVPADEEEVAEEQETASIEFAEEPNQEADVIIVQHAPYAAPVQEQDLLELDEEGDKEQVEREKGKEGQVEREKGKEEQGEREKGKVDAAEVVEVELQDHAVLEEESPEEEEEELTSENLIKAVVKDETDMEEPDVPEIPQVDVVEQEVRGSKNKKLIEQFIKGDAGPIRADAEITLKGDVSTASIREHDGFITDTLAKIYVKQGLYAKAIYAYEKLSLKYPEKSAYFAAQIEKIKNINQS